MIPPLNGTFFTDAAGWPDTITVTVTYHYSDANTTKTGTATFTYTRMRLADDGGGANLLGDGAADVSNGKFLPLESALGNMPGWVVYFGPQDPITDAFTVTYPKVHGSTPTHEDATCSVQMDCSNFNAPGCRMLAAGVNGFAGLNAARFLGPYTGPASYTVELIQPSVPASGATPAVLPVYRLTLPGGVLGINYLEVMLNGAARVCVEHARNLEVDLYTAQTLRDWQEAFARIGTAYRRSEFVVDIELLNEGDVLAPGKCEFQGPRPFAPFLYTNGPDDQIVQFDLADPFALTSLNLTHEDPEGQFTVTVVAG